MISLVMWLVLILIPFVLVSYDIEIQNRDMLILLFVILITLQTQQTYVSRKEHMDASMSSNEAIANLASVYSSGNATLTNLEVTGSLTAGSLKTGTLTCDEDATFKSIDTPTIKLGSGSIRSAGSRMAFKNSNEYVPCCANPELEQGEFSLDVTSDNIMRWWSATNNGKYRGRVEPDSSAW